MTIRIIIAFVAALFLPLPLAAQTLAPMTLQADVEAGIAQIRADNDLPAIGAIVLIDGEQQALAVEGLRRVSGEDEVTVDDLWHIGSITKSMTATLAATLVEDGTYQWDMTLAEMLPDLADEMHLQWREVTLEQLLTHTSGAPANFSIFAQRHWPDTLAKLVAKRREVLAGTLAKPPVTEPGTEYQYSNIGFTIAGHAIETTLGIPWEQAMEDKLFTPLGLDSAGFGPPQGDQPWGHGSFFGRKVAKDPAKGGADNTPVMGPAGTVHISLQDLASWGNHHLMGELGMADGYLESATYQVLHEPKLEDYAKGWVAWNRDWGGDSEGMNVIWHNGSNTMWYALLVLLPEKNAVVAIVTNDGTSNQAKDDFFALTVEIATSLPQSDGTSEE